MAVLTAEQVAQICYQAGFRGEDLVAMVGIAKRESGYRTDAHRTDSNPANLSGDRGLFQINYSNDSALMAAGIVRSRSDYFDPIINARAAYWLFQHAGGLSPWGMGPNGWAEGGDPFRGVNLEAARTAVNNAGAQGLLGADFAGVGSIPANYGATPNSAADAGGQTVVLPSDVQIVNIAGTYDIYATFDVGGVRIAYKVDTAPGAVDWKSKPLTTLTLQQFNNGGFVQAGSARELATVTSTFGNYKSFWDSILSQVMGQNNPARYDPEVIKIIAEFAARPDMSALELQNKLQATQWFQQRTSSELEWNGLAEAEKQKRRDEARARMLDTWQQFLGQRLDPSDPRIANYLEQVASGRMGFGAFTEIVKQQSLAFTESPYARDVRAEEEAQRQRPIDIENTSQRIRDTMQRWGVTMQNSEITRWAKEIVEKRKSDQDLLDTLKQQAAVLYPWKDPEMETITAAQPWLSTYERVMERGGSLQTPRIQAALTAGLPAWEFETQLKRTSDWMGTRNAREEMFGIMQEAGRRMGYS